MPVVADLSLIKVHVLIWALQWIIVLLAGLSKPLAFVRSMGTGKFCAIVKENLRQE